MEEYKDTWRFLLRINDETDVDLIVPPGVVIRHIPFINQSFSLVKEPTHTWRCTITNNPALGHTITGGWSRARRNLDLRVGDIVQFRWVPPAILLIEEVFHGGRVDQEVTALRGRLTPFEMDCNPGFEWVATESEVRRHRLLIPMPYRSLLPNHETRLHIPYNRSDKVWTVTYTPSSEISSIDEAGLRSLVEGEKIEEGDRLEFEFIEVDPTVGVFTLALFNWGKQAIEEE